MPQHDPGLDGGRAALIAQLDEANRRSDQVVRGSAAEILLQQAKVSELAVKLSDALAKIERLELAEGERIMLERFRAAQKDSLIIPWPTVQE